MNPTVEAARIEVERRRAQLMDTARELQDRVQPGTLASEAWEKAKIKGADLAEDAVDAVKRRPVAAGGVIAAITLFLAREPIKDLVAKAYDAMTSTPEEEQPSVPPRPRRRRASKKTEKVK